MKFYSQYGQDEWIYNFFDKKRSGFFIEIGADDGIDKSNTKFFEDLGWNGMCIEPSKKRFQELLNNRKCLCENYAISDKKGEVDFMDILGYGKGLSGIIENYTEKHTKRIESEIKNPKNMGHSKIKVQTETLSNLLHKHNIINIDFCTIDVEGSEFEIVRSIDYEKYNIKLLVIENNYNDKKVENFLKKNGFKKIKRIIVDDIYINTEID